MFDYLIVGAGFAGSVLAERLAKQANKKVLVVEKRNHIGGNAFDCYDESGLLIHKYGPQFRRMASSVPDAGRLLDEELTTAELPRMTASCPASTAPPPASPAC